MSAVFSERVLVLLALLITAVALLAITFGKSYSDVGSAHSPVFFPRIILVIWIALAVIAIVQALIAQEGSRPVHSLLRLGLLVVAVVAYTNLLTSYGFFLTSVAFSLLCLPLFGIRNPLIVGAYALAVPGALVLLFNHTLGMPLPTSPFTYYF